MRHANRLKRNGFLSPRGRGVTAAHQTFNLAGEGSNPSGPAAALPQRKLSRESRE